MSERRTAEMMGRPLTDAEKLENIDWFMEHCAKCEQKIEWDTNKCPHCGYYNLSPPSTES
jgi:ribosomal protein L40E